MRKKIEIENIRDADQNAAEKNKKQRERKQSIPHPGLGEGGKYRLQRDRAPAAGERDADFRPGRESELRQDDSFQSAHRFQPARGEFSRRDGGPERRFYPGKEKHTGDRPSGHLFHVALFQRGDRDKELRPG